ncbi:hypothetical protein [Micromonospora sp. DT47]|uniref:hypothetical protein n=1 Tax=Micromonospora sp. DT47 TaxID=3393431 RepID=UPI003CE71855
MTSAPANLLAVRRLLLDHLHIEAAALGITGDPDHRGGYHCGADRVLPEDYSVVESARDRTGLADWACALDVGDFSVSVAGKRHTLATFSMWLVAQCKANAADTRDIREIIYSPDGQVVRRWDRLGRRTSGDSSHRWHTHISYHRDAIKAGRDQSAVMRRYLTEIGLLEDDMPTLDEIRTLLRQELGTVPGAVMGSPSAPWVKGSISAGGAIFEIHGQAKAIRAGQAALLAAVEGVDTEQVLARIDQLAAEDQARDEQLAELVRAGLAGEVAAEEVLRRMGEILTAGTTPQG